MVGSSLALLSPGVDMSEGRENSSIVQWSLEREGTMKLYKIWVISGVPWNGGAEKNERAASFIGFSFALSLLSSVSRGIQQEHSCRREQVTGQPALGGGSAATSPTDIPHTASH